MVLLSVSSGTSVGRLRVSFFFEPWLVRAFSALTLSVEQQEGHPACKKTLGGCGGGGAVSPVGVRPRRLRGAWFSRLLRHPARRWSGSLLSPGTHTACIITISQASTDDAFDRSVVSHLPDCCRVSKQRGGVGVTNKLPMDSNIQLA